MTDSHPSGISTAKSQGVTRVPNPWLFVWLTDVIAKTGCFLFKCLSLISSCEEYPVCWREAERDLGQGPEVPLVLKGVVATSNCGL